RRTGRWIRRAGRGRPPAAGPARANSSSGDVSGALRPQPAVAVPGAGPTHVPADRRAADLPAEQVQLVGDAHRTPGGVLAGEPLDQAVELARDLGPPEPLSALPAPQGPEPRPVPAQD